MLSPRWLDMLGCTVLAVNDDPSAPFPHRPEPKPETMAQLKAVVRAGGADLGFAHDADGERIGLVTAAGVALSEERTLTLATAIALSHGRRHGRHQRLHHEGGRRGGDGGTAERWCGRPWDSRSSPRR